MLIEVISYQIKADITEQTIRQTSEAVNGLLASQAGFQYRSLSYDASNNQWFDILYWENEASCEAADVVFMASAEGQALIALAQPDSVVMRKMPILSQRGEDTEAA